MQKFAPKKSIGQHFLHDQNISKKIINFLEINDNDTIVEIGPGTGALTQFLLNTNINLIAYEIDKRSVDFLKKEYKSFIGSKFQIVEDDFLNSNLNQIASKSQKKIKVVGNIPYYITSPILFHLCRHSNNLDKAVLMMQKDVYRRLIAKPRTKEYGILTILANMFFKVIDKFEVPPSCFLPPPKVMSMVVKLNFDQNMNQEDIESKFKVMELVKSLFNQRRKMINNTIQKYLTQRNLSLDDLRDWPKYSKYSKMRPEELSLQDYLILYDFLSQKTQILK